MNYNFRPYVPDDLAALYAISLATGDVGGDASDLYDDGHMIGHIYSAPYGVLAPKFCQIVEDEKGVAGYAVGAADTYKWQELLEDKWWPHLREKYANPSYILPHNRTADQRRAYMIHHPVYVPNYVLERFPAHMHMNLLPRMQGRGLGAKLLKNMLDRMSGYNIKALHVGINRSNKRAATFWQNQLFKPITTPTNEVSRGLWLGRNVVISS